jgi:hypothetical protein
VRGDDGETDGAGEAGTDRPSEIDSEQRRTTSDRLTQSVPRGSLAWARTVGSLDATLGRVLRDELTGYVVVESGAGLVVGDPTHGVLTFVDGVPVLAYAVDSPAVVEGDSTVDAVGPDALTALVGPGPARVEVYSVPTEEMASLHAAGESTERDESAASCRVSPDAPALAFDGSRALVRRTRERAGEQ